MLEVEELGKCLLSSLTFHSTNPLTTGCLAIHPCSSSAPFTEVRPNLQQRRRKYKPLSCCTKGWAPEVSKLHYINQPLKGFVRPGPYWTSLEWGWGGGRICHLQGANALSFPVCSRLARWQAATEGLNATQLVAAGLWTSNLLWLLVKLLCAYSLKAEILLSPSIAAVLFSAT